MYACILSIVNPARVTAAHSHYHKPAAKLNSNWKLPCSKTIDTMPKVLSPRMDRTAFAIVLPGPGGQTCAPFSRNTARSRHGRVSDAVAVGGTVQLYATLRVAALYRHEERTLWPRIETTAAAATTRRNTTASIPNCSLKSMPGDRRTPPTSWYNQTPMPPPNMM